MSRNFIRKGSKLVSFKGDAYSVTLFARPKGSAEMRNFNSKAVVVSARKIVADYISNNHSTKPVTNKVIGSKKLSDGLLVVGRVKVHGLYAIRKEFRHGGETYFYSFFPKKHNAH